MTPFQVLGRSQLGNPSQNLWRGLAEIAPAVDLVVLVSREPLAAPFLGVIRAAPRHEIHAVGLAGLLPHLDRRGKYSQVLTLIETELGLGMRLDRLGRGAPRPSKICLLY